MSLRIRVLATVLPMLAACTPAADPAERSLFSPPFGADSAAAVHLMQQQGLRPVQVNNTGSGRFMLFAGRSYLWLGGNDSTRLDSTAHVVVALSPDGRLGGIAVSADFVDSSTARAAFERLQEEARSAFGEPGERSDTRSHWEAGDTLSVNVAVRQRPAATTTHVVAVTVTHIGMIGRTDEARGSDNNEVQ